MQTLLLDDADTTLHEGVKPVLARHARGVLRLAVGAGGWEVGASANGAGAIARAAVASGRRELAAEALEAVQGDAGRRRVADALTLRRGKMGRI